MSGAPVKSRYFDGVSPIPNTGKVSIEENYLVFQPDDGSHPHKIPLSRVSEIDRVGDEFKVTVRRTKNMVSEMIMTNDQNFIDHITTHKKKSLSGILQFGFSSSEGGFFKAFIPALTIAVFVLVGFWGFIQKAHYLVPTSVDEKIGELATPQFLSMFPRCENEPLQNAVEQMIDEVTYKPTFTYKVVLIESPEVNAFALPGGPIFVFSGLLEQSESPEEVMGVLAHEITHAERRHGLQNIIKKAGTFFIISSVIGVGFEGFDPGMAEEIVEIAGTMTALRYSRSFERESDRGAIELLERKGYSAAYLKSFFEKIKDKDIGEEFSWVSTHPTTEERIKYIEKAIHKEDGKMRKKLPISETRWNKLKVQCQS